jgi:hypothetical protein
MFTRPDEKLTVKITVCTKEYISPSSKFGRRPLWADIVEKVESGAALENQRTDFIMFARPKSPL